VATATGTRTVVGVFNSVQDAQAAVRDLESQGISRDEISIVANKNAAGYETMDAADRDKASDVVADAGIGAAIGGVGGLLLSAAGAVTIPVIGPILAAGPIAAALTGAGIGAATGGLIGALTESGIPEEHAKYYAEGVRRGDVLVTVRTDDTHADQVCDVLDRHNAVDVDERVRDWKERGWTGYNTEAEPYSDDELRRERSYYNTGSTLTGESGIGVDKQRSTLHRDRDDLRTAGDIGTSGTVGTVSTTGMTSAGVGSARTDDRSVGEKIGDKLHEWKEDVKDTGRELRDEARENQREMDRETSSWKAGQPGRGDIGDRAKDTAAEIGRDVREAGRDTKDVLTGHTGTQPHDVREDLREAERRRRARVYDRW